MSRRIVASLVALWAGIAMSGSRDARAHSIQYEVKQTGVAVRAYYSASDPAAYSQYELRGPGDEEAHQTGRTDRNGYLAFVPDRPGIWRVQVWGESSHGFHGVSTDVKVDQALNVESFSKPLVATHTKLVTGVSLAFGLFGLYALWASRRKGDRPA
jgi:nickel transport protein